MKKKTKKDLKALPSSLYYYLALSETLLFVCVCVGVCVCMLAHLSGAARTQKVKVGIACSKDGRGLAVAVLQKSFCLMWLKFS